MQGTSGCSQDVLRTRPQVRGPPRGRGARRGRRRHHGALRRGEALQRPAPAHVRVPRRDRRRRRAGCAAQRGPSGTLRILSFLCASGTPQSNTSNDRCAFLKSRQCTSPAAPSAHVEEDAPPSGSDPGDDAATRAGAVSAALVLALAVGLVQAAFFLLAAPALISSMGVAADSAMRPVALSAGGDIRNPPSPTPSRYGHHQDPHSAAFWKLTLCYFGAPQVCFGADCFYCGKKPRQVLSPRPRAGHAGRDPVARRERDLPRPRRHAHAAGLGAALLRAQRGAGPALHLPAGPWRRGRRGGYLEKRGESGLQ